MSSASEQETPQWMAPILAAVQVAVLGEMMYTVRRALVRLARTCSMAYICTKAYLRAMWYTPRRRWTVVAAYAIRGPLKSSESSDSESITQSDTESSSKTQDFVVLDHSSMRPGDDPDWTSHIWAQVPAWWGHEGWRVELRVQRGCQKRRLCLPAMVLPRIHEVLQWPRDIHCRVQPAIVASACLIPAPGQQEGEAMDTPHCEAMDITSRVQKYVMVRDVPMHPAWLFPMDDMDSHDNSMMGRWLGVAIRTLDLWGHSKTYEFEWHDDMRIMFYNL